MKLNHESETGRVKGERRDRGEREREREISHLPHGDPGTLMALAISQILRKEQLAGER